MIATWMLYALAVSLLTGLAGWAFEKAARAARLPGRMVWLGSLFVSVAVPVYALLNPVKVPGAVAFSSVSAGGSSSFSFLTLPTLTSLDEFSSILTLTWIVASVVLAALFAWTLRRVASETDTLPLDRVNGIAVRRSRVFGPALVGILRQQVVIPAWLGAIDPEAEDLATRHENSHLIARDPQLQLTALLLAISMPWNPVLWWQFMRLREAVELDCDIRVLRSGADMKSYASLLLEIAGNRIRSPFPAVAFLSTTTQLGRRVTTMAEQKKPPRYLKTFLVAALGVTLAATACETPQPVEVDSAADAALSTRADAVQAEHEVMKARYGRFIADSLHEVMSAGDNEFHFGPDGDAGAAAQAHFELIERDPSLVGMTREEFQRHLEEVEEAAGAARFGEPVFELLHDGEEVQLRQLPPEGAENEVTLQEGQLRTFQLREEGEAQAATNPVTPEN